MKVYFFVAAIVVTLASVAPASDNDKERNPSGTEWLTHIGPQIGLNFSSADISSSQNSGTKLGITGGLVAESRLIPGLFYVQPELNYIRRGASNVGGGPDISLDYFELPIFLKAKITLVSVKPFLMAGPRVGVLFNSSVPNQFSTFDFGLDFGIGLALVSGEFSEGYLAIKSSFSLTDIDSSANSWKNHGVELLLGYLF
jgi:hypothetical protein